MPAPTDFTPGLPVAPVDHIAVIDLLNRFNMATDVWDIDTMVGSFADDGAVLHPRGAFRGHVELRTFFAGYRTLVPGTRRQGVGHVVTGSPDGSVSVTFYMLILRVAEPVDADAARIDPLTESGAGLPAPFIHSIVSTRVRRTDGGGWRIAAFEVDGAVADHAMRRDD